MATARERARVQLTADIKAAARRQLATEGAAALSLRAVARELGMVSSAVYRYFPSRDDLVTALIVDAYDAVGAAVEEAVARTEGRAFDRRFLALAEALRSWARETPHDYALVYGSPIPGYRAPTTTIAAASRPPFAALAVVDRGVVDGEVACDGRPAPRHQRAALRRIREAAAPHTPDDVLVRALAAWTGLFGHLTFELFGHFTNVIDDLDAYFTLQASRAAAAIRTPERPDAAATAAGKMRT
jgi:AcrR family transcriptional regulator